MSANHALTALVSLALLAGVQRCAVEPGAESTATPWPVTSPSSWQWQRTGQLDLDVDADVFVLDPFDTPAEAVWLLRDRDRHVVCHVNAGWYEPDRPDAPRFPPAVLGSTAGPSRSRWLDVRQWSLLEPILADRFRLCRGKGFQAVALDRVDAYAHRSGFPLTFDDQLVFNRRLAELVRATGLAPGLHNDVAQATALEPEFDFAVNEECVRLGGCGGLVAFVAAGKPVLHVEYDLPTGRFCVTSVGHGFVSMRKERSLTAWRDVCRH